MATTIIIQAICLLVQIGCGGLQIHLYRLNTARYEQYGNKSFLRLRWFSVGMIIWGTFFAAWAVFWILHAVRVIG